MIPIIVIILLSFVLSWVIIKALNYISLKEMQIKIRSKKKLYCLIGRSATGKSTIEKKLRKYGFLPVVSFTTRPMRQGETNGVDYHFMTDEEANRMLENGQVLEYAEYNGWKYGTLKQSINLDNGSHLIVVNPHGFKQLQDSLGKENVVGIYIHSPLWNLLKRSLDRQPNATENECKEICRRFLSDFDTFKDIDKLCDIKVINIDVDNCVNYILSCILGDLI